MSSSPALPARARAGALTSPLAALALLAALLPATAGASPSTPAAPDGLYAGTTSQGQPVRLQFGHSPTTGQPALLFVEITYQLACGTTGTTRLDGFAVSADQPLDAAGGLRRTLWTARYWGRLATTWQPATDTVSGTTALTAGFLLPELPARAEACEAPAVSFSAVRQ